MSALLNAWGFDKGLEVNVVAVEVVQVDEVDRDTRKEGEKRRRMEG